MGLTLSALNSILACAVCVGSPDHAATWGMNMAIAFMLMVVGTIFSGIVAFMVYLARKAREAEALEGAGG